MFLIRDWLKIKEVKIGLQEARISLSFLEVVLNLFMELINTLIRFHRFIDMFKFSIWEILSRAAWLNFDWWPLLFYKCIQMVPDIQFGRRTRVVLDVGCGVASFGAFLLPRKVAPLSIAPKDAHENQIQFALERGVPAMVAAFATRRLLYPSQAFDLIHCSRCRINWTRDG